MQQVGLNTQTMTNIAYDQNEVKLWIFLKKQTDEVSCPRCDCENPDHHVDITIYRYQIDEDICVLQTVWLFQ